MAQYKAIASIPVFSRENTKNIRNIPFEGRLLEKSEWDSLPSLEYNRAKCRQFRREFLDQFLNKPDPFAKIFNYLEIIQTSYEDRLLLKHVQRLAMRLNLYSLVEPKNGFAIDPRHYLTYSLEFGPEFTVWLSKIRAAAVIKTLSFRPIQSNLKFIDEHFGNELFSPILIKRDKFDYDSFLNERFLIFFKETGSDFEWAFKPIHEDEDKLTLFRLAARTMLFENKLQSVKEAGREEFSTWISDSVTSTDAGPVINRKLIRELSEKGQLDALIKRDGIRPLRFNRKIVHVEPGNVRDTWQCFPETLFVIKRTSFLLRQILKPIEFSGMCSNSQFLKRKKLLKKKKNFFMFDIKKCGLTVNRRLIGILAEELSALYPDKGFEELFSYLDIKVENDGQTTRPIRGVGLGNCNEGITLIQCVIGYIMKHKSDLDSIFFNDDGVFTSEGDIRRSFSLTLSLFENLGMIINREKTMISKMNIFCEDYVTDNDLDYRKLSLTVLPFADCFFKRNIFSAKLLYNTLSRGLIGKRISIDILPCLIKYYGFEFHKMESVLPFEFGGWAYYGRTSINEVLRFLFSPKIFLSGGEAGYSQFMREWMGYIIRRHDLSNLSKSGKKIPFRKFVPNPFKGWETILGDSELGRDLARTIPYTSCEEERKNLDILYNERGSKNAKPKIRIGFLDKQIYVRNNIWKGFLRARSDAHTLDAHAGHLNLALNYLRDFEITQNGYCPPDFMVLGVQELPDSLKKKMGRLIIPVNKDIDHSVWGRSRLIESISLGRIVKGTEIFSLSSEMEKARDKHILSNDMLYDSIADSKPPSWIYRFLPRREFARILFIKIMNDEKVPCEWNDFPSYRELADVAINPIRHIFPECHNRFRKLMRGSSQMILLCFQEFLKGVEVNSSKDFNILLDVFESMLYNEDLEDPPPDKGDEEPFLDALQNHVEDEELTN